MKQGTAVTYRVFTRTWWRQNSTTSDRGILAWPDGLEPCAGRKTTIARHCTEQEARAIAQEYNATHKPGRLSRKAELEQE